MKHNPERLEKAAGQLRLYYPPHFQRDLPLMRALEAYISHDPLGLARELAGPDMVVVSREPTEEMIADLAADYESRHYICIEDGMEAIYRAMIAKAGEAG